MTTSASPATTDRSDFRTVIGAGAKTGVVTAIAVVLFLASARALPTGIVRSLAQALIALATGLAVTFLPARWAGPRSTEGIAGCAAIGLWGTVVFSAIDIVLFRPLKAYPWTWDAIGGGATWWYLPIWWMLGTYLAWIGGLRWAALQARGGGEGAMGRATLPVIAGGVLLAVVTTLLRPGVPLPVAVGGGFVVTLTVLAVADIARKR